MMHNRYRQQGGEDVSVKAEIELLASRGVDVIPFLADNETDHADPPISTRKLALSSAWSRDSYDTTRRLCAHYRPDVVHVQNFWMRLSPSVHAACRKEGIPNVQTLRNFRLFCLNSLFLRDGGVCEDCLGKSVWRGVARRCYRDSLSASAAVARMIETNRRRRTWQEDVKAFVALTEHSRSKVVAGGLPPGRVFVKPNFVEDFALDVSAPSASRTILSVGRLSREKGIGTLLAAWAHGGLQKIGRLEIIGDGPERPALERQAEAYGFPPHTVRFLGQQTHDQVSRHIRAARAVVLPSLWYETFGRLVVEAFAAGRPAVVSSIGAMDELVASGRTGLKSAPGDAIALSESLRALLASDSLADRLGSQARQEYLARYTPDENYSRLLEIYGFAMGLSQPPLVPNTLVRHAPVDKAAVLQHQAG